METLQGELTLHGQLAIAMNDKRDIFDHDNTVTTKDNTFW
jgi:hypothetical protein